MILTLQRAGAFRIGQCNDDTTQCGMRGSRTLLYNVQITSTEKQLDENGFIIDNHEVQRYFDERYRQVDRFLSCEEVACHAVADLKRLVGARRCKSVKVTIRPSGIAAGLTAEWSAPSSSKRHRQ